MAVVYEVIFKNRPPYQEMKILDGNCKIIEFFYVPTMIGDVIFGNLWVPEVNKKRWRFVNASVKLEPYQ